LSFERSRRDNDANNGDNKKIYGLDYQYCCHRHFLTIAILPVDSFIPCGVNVFIQCYLRHNWCATRSASEESPTLYVHDLKTLLRKMYLLDDLKHKLSISMSMSRYLKLIRSITYQNPNKQLSYGRETARSLRGFRRPALFAKSCKKVHFAPPYVRIGRNVIGLFESFNAKKLYSRISSSECQF